MKKTAVFQRGIFTITWKVQSPGTRVLRRTKTTAWIIQVITRPLPVRYARTIDMFFPTSMYPDTCWTPGVVSQIPEFSTYRKFRSLWIAETNVECGMALVRTDTPSAMVRRSFRPVLNNISAHNISLPVDARLHIEDSTWHNQFERVEMGIFVVDINLTAEFRPIGPLEKSAFQQKSYHIILPLTAGLLA